MVVPSHEEGGLSCSPFSGSRGEIREVDTEEVLVRIIAQGWVAFWFFNNSGNKRQ